jgi:HEAT repeat protein
VFGHLGNAGAAPALLAVAERADAPMELRRASLRAAAAVADLRALPRLLALRDAGDGALAATAVWAVGRIRTPAATAALVATLDPTHATELRATAALGLSATRDPAARAALLRVLDAPGDELVRGAALLALGAGGDPAALPRSRALRGSGYYLTAAALAVAPALREGPARCAESVAPWLFSSVPAPTPAAPELAQVAAAALVACRSGVVAVSERVFEDPALAASPYALFGAAVSARRDDVAAEAALLQFRAQVAGAARAAMLLADGQDRVRVALATADAFPPLLTRVTDRAGFDRARAEVLAALAPTLGALASSQSAGARRDALRLLGDSGATGRAEALALLSREPDARVAESALAALTPSPDDRASPALEAQLAASAPWSLRLAAVEALGRGGDARAASTLARVLRDDPSAWVRAEAARALRAHRADADVRAALQTAREDQDIAVRDAAAEALAP